MQPWLLDYRLLASDNEERDIIWVRGHSIPRIQEDGSIIWHGMITDITDIKKTEETLRMLRRAVESAAEGILVTDASEDNIVIFANEKFFKDTGYTREEVMGHNCRFLQGKDTDRNTVNRIREAIAEQKLFIGEIYNYKKDGTPFWNMLVVAPVLNDDGKVSHFVGLINDITERKEAEKKLLEQNNQLRKINQELDRFVYSVSHDLRAPLTSVLGLIELTYERTADQQAKQYLQLMEESIVKLDTTIKDILDYSRNTRTETLIEQVNLRSLIDEVFTGLHCMQNADLVAKYIEIDEAAPCFSDRKRLLLILHNILSNAIKYHNPLIANPFIHIQVQVTLDEVSIVIHDNGIGIPEKHIDKIFDMFFRASKLSTGTGLGLYIVKETVAKLNGNIKVDSCPDQGSTFTITLPNYAQVN
jgi:PAS domain S-box-containing protein